LRLFCMAAFIMERPAAKSAVSRRGAVACSHSNSNMVRRSRGDAEPNADSPRASGTLEAHYAPRARLRLMPTSMLNTALQMLGNSALKLAVYSRSIRLPQGSPLRWRAMPDDPDRAAHELFSTLRELDAEGPDLIWVEEPPTSPAWDGVRDRLRRAAAA